MLKTSGFMIRSVLLSADSHLFVLNRLAYIGFSVMHFHLLFYNDQSFCIFVLCVRMIPLFCYRTMNRYLFWLRDHHDILGKIFLFSLIIWLLIMIFPREGKFRYEYQKGKPWQHDDLIAPVDFAILKPAAELKAEQDAALKDSRPYFRRMHSVADGQINYLINSFDRAWESRYGRQAGDDLSRKSDLELILSVLDTLFSHGVVNIINEIENKAPDYEIFIVDGNTASRVPLSRLYTIRTAETYITKRLIRRRFRSC